MTEICVWAVGETDPGSRGGGAESCGAPLPICCCTVSQGPPVLSSEADSVVEVSGVTAQVGSTDYSGRGACLALHLRMQSSPEDGVPQGLYLGLSFDDHTRNQPPSDQAEGKKLRWI